jgi:hypothetical protein
MVRAWFDVGQSVVPRTAGRVRGMELCGADKIAGREGHEGITVFRLRAIKYLQTPTRVALMVSGIEP